MDLKNIKKRIENNEPLTKEELRYAIIKKVNISNVNLSNISDLSFLFYNIKDKDYLNTLDISNWDISKVESIDNIFYESEININQINNWNFSNIQSMNMISDNPKKLIELYQNNNTISEELKFEFIEYYLSSNSKKDKNFIELLEILNLEILNLELKNEKKSKNMKNN